jgi:hypothetical protein
MFTILLDCVVRPKVYQNLSSFEVWPKKTFLGLDKSRAHCFTLPKSITQSVIEYFKLKPEYLQQNIIFVIDGMDYQAIARMVIMDRSKPNKLQKEELPSRTITQFQWNAFDDTCEEMNYKLSEAYNIVSNGGQNDIQSVIFTHVRLNRFYLEFTNSNDPDYQIFISEN